MPDYNPQMILSPADFADTGQWRLLIYISPAGFRALLKHVSDPLRPVVLLCNVEWNDNEPSHLLNNIENAVYDHPGLLDDYATEIIICTPDICFAPNSVIDSTDDAESLIFSALYPGDSYEVISDRLPSMTALFSLTRGLDGFVSRTIPGARIRSHLAVLIEAFAAKQSQSATSLYVDIREAEADLILFSDGQLFSASVQRWRTPEDITYRIFNLLNAYSIEPNDTTIFLSGKPDVRAALSDILRRLHCEVVATPLPAQPSQDNPLPLPLLLRTISH